MSNANGYALGVGRLGKGNAGPLSSQALVKYENLLNWTNRIVENCNISAELFIAVFTVFTTAEFACQICFIDFGLLDKTKLVIQI